MANVIFHLVVVCAFQTSGAEPSQTRGLQNSPRQPGDGLSSSFVERTMKGDKDSDGLLSGGELPGMLKKVLGIYDTDKDQKISPAELAVFGREARATLGLQRPQNSGPPQTGRRGLRRGPASAASSGPAAPAGAMDSSQILSFALTFDADKDGRLDAGELKRYADGLVARRGQRRRGGNADGTGTAPKGLGADGKGGGSGFGE